MRPVLPLTDTQLFEFSRVVTTLQANFISDQTLLIQVTQGLVHRLHTFSATCLDDRGNLVGLVFANQVTNCRAGNHDLDGSHSSRLSGPWQKLLGGDSHQVV